MSIEKIYKAVRLVLVGPMEDHNINNLIKKNKKIIYVGETSTPEKWFSLGDIFCLPSHERIWCSYN